MTDWNNVGIIVAIGISVLTASRDLIKDRIEKRKSEDHEGAETVLAPAERDGVIVKSAETVVGLLERSLSAAHATNERLTDRVVRLETEVRQKDDALRLVEGENASLRRQIKTEGDYDTQR